jgi:hypothetical protein
MKAVGYLLLTIGFLAGALVSVLDETTVGWNYLIGSVILAVVGIAIIRIGHKKEHHAEGKLASNMEAINDSLGRIVESIAKIDTEKDTMSPYDVRDRIDELVAADIITFVDARESISAVYGLQAYADVMSYFAAGERYLNRVWSASADGYIDEVAMYLGKSRQQFVDALVKIKEFESQT